VARARRGEGTLMSRDNILHKVRTALGRSAGQPAPALAPPRLRVLPVDLETRLQSFSEALEELAGKFYRAASLEDARAYAAALLGGKTAVASSAALLRECGITALDGVRSGVTEERELRELCARVDVGITSADYALADTGTLVMFSSREEARMISLLPPVHLAVVRTDRILTGLDQLFTLEPLPGQRSSSMVLITGPSRTADIEQILIRGVHGPGELHVVVI
jgi:L-lactate dehydrogenase complex protein LldG